MKVRRGAGNLNLSDNLGEGKKGEASLDHIRERLIPNLLKASFRFSHDGTRVEKNCEDILFGIIFE